MPVLRAERRLSAASKSRLSAARSKSTPPIDQHRANEQIDDGVDEDDNETLLLFKHTPLPSNIDDDNNDNNDNTATTSQSTTTTTSSAAIQSSYHKTKSQPTAVQLSSTDYEKLKLLYRTITTTASQLTQSIHSHRTALPSQPPTAAGNSLYELKNRLLLQYVLRMVHVIRLRVSGVSIADEASVDEMNEIRVILERIRPMEKKIKYAIDKLLAAPAVPPSASASTDPLHYRPNPLDLLPPTTAVTTNTTTARKKSRPAAAASAVVQSPPTSPTASALYQAPHHVPMLPTDTARGRKQPRVSSARLRSLYGELGDAPEERLVEGGGYGEMGEVSDAEEEKREYEERMMVRLVETKEDKKRKRDRERRKGLDNMDEYDELRQFVANRERVDRGDDQPGGGGRNGGGGGGERRGAGGGRVADGAGGSRSSVDELFNGVERGEGPRKRAKTGGGSKRGKSSRGGKGRGGKRR